MSRSSFDQYRQRARAFVVDGGEEGPSTPTGSDTYLYSQEQELGQIKMRCSDRKAMRSLPIPW
jgi:hypothetical protein